MLVNTTKEQSAGYLATATDEKAVVGMTYVDKKTISNKSVSIGLKLETLSDAENFDKIIKMKKYLHLEIKFLPYIFLYSATILY